MSSWSEELEKEGAERSSLGKEDNSSAATGRQEALGNVTIQQHPDTDRAAGRGMRSFVISSQAKQSSSASACSPAQGHGFVPTDPG